MAQTVDHDVPRHRYDDVRYDLLGLGDACTWLSRDPAEGATRTTLGAIESRRRHSPSAAVPLSLGVASAIGAGLVVGTLVLSLLTLIVVIAALRKAGKEDALPEVGRPALEIEPFHLIESFHSSRESIHSIDRSITESISSYQQTRPRRDEGGLGVFVSRFHRDTA